MSPWLGYGNHHTQHSVCEALRVTNGKPMRPSLKKGRFVYCCPAVYANPAP